MATPTTFRAYAAIALFLALVPAAPAQYSGGSGTAEDPYQIATAADLIALGETVPGIGAAGDSLTDEYSQRGGNYGDASALCWVDLLGRLRGPTSTMPELTLGDYQTSSMGSPRYRGYTYNWALAGADTATLLSQGQHTGLANQVRQGQVQYVALIVGTNDFYPAYEALYSGTTPIPGADGKQYPNAAAYVDSIVARYTTALDTLSDAGAKVVMATIADHGSLPSWAKDFRDAEKRQHITDATIAANDRLRDLAVERGLPFVDVYELLNLFYVDATPSDVGGVSILKTVAPTPDARYAVLPDGFHPGTIWQGLLANAFLEACNRTYKTSFTPLSDQEILTAAGLARLVSAGDSFFDIRPYVSVPAWARYSGGTGEPNDPYQIATAADLIALGETSDDYDKHFILTADIDLDPNLPGRKVFDRAVIGPDEDPETDYFQGTPFTGVFDGSGHTILHLTITGKDYLGLFGQLDSWDIRSAEVENLELVDVKITGTGTYVGGLVGQNHGSIGDCCSSGSVCGTNAVGGLVGGNQGTLRTSHSNGSVTGTRFGVGGLVGWNYGSIAASSSHGSVSGVDGVGGLAGTLSWGSIAGSYSGAAVNGRSWVGGFVGANNEVDIGDGNGGAIVESYSTGNVSGENLVGGLVGENGGTITTSYSRGWVRGVDCVGGFVGKQSWGSIADSYSSRVVDGTSQVGGLVGSDGGFLVRHSFWDIETSGQSTSAGGVDKTTGEMQTAKTFLDSGWDFMGETANGTDDIWWILEGKDYPRLWWELGETGVDDDRTADEQR